MTGITGPALLLFMSMMIDCPPVPVSEDEKAEITKAAYESRSAAAPNTDFESISITKCVSRWEWDEPEHVQGRTERTGLYGLFPHTVQTSSYRERYSIRCHKTVNYRGDSFFDQSDGCSEELERYMQYHGLEQEVRLRGSVSVEDATAYLDYLLDYDFGTENQVRVDTMLRKIQSVEVRGRGHRLKFGASFSHGGCATTTFEASATRDEALVFGRVDGHMSIC